MKLRIRNNSVRLRLTRSEIDTFAHDGELFETTRFPTRTVLTYGLKMSTGTASATARFRDGAMEICLPDSDARRWCGSDEVSMAAVVDAGDGARLDILVEKDFACLSPRQDEDESDMFPHPDAGTKTC